VLSIDVPPLRNRPGDLLPLAESLYCELAIKMGRQIEHMPLAIAEQVQQRMWSGNVRELKNYLERSLIFGDEVIEDDLDLTLIEAIQRFECAWVNRVVDDCGGDKAEAANRLGIGLSTLYRKLEA